MIASDGYAIIQHRNKNKIEILLPQTWGTLESTASTVSNRKDMLTPEEESTILCIVKAMFEGK